MQQERKQLSESKKRLRSIEETVDRLTEKVDQLAEKIGQLAESQPEEDRLDRETLREELQKGIPKELQELKSTLQDALEEGIPLEGAREFRQMKRKVGQLVDKIEVKADLLRQEEKIQDTLNEALRDLENEKRKMKTDRSGLFHRLEKTADALDSGWWRVTGTSLVGGAVGTLILAGAAWASTETLPQEWRMTQEEIRQIEGLERLQNATSDHLTEEEYETYRKLLKKAYERDQDSRQ